MSLPLRVAAIGLACLAGSASLTPAVGEPASRTHDPTLLLQRYLRIDTSNPPGREETAAAFLADLLHREGISTRLLVSPAGRTSLYARLEGGPGSDGSLVLLHHMDVVPPADNWSVEPFAGVLRDGFLWGPGAVDDKSLGIAQLLAFVDLHRRGVDLTHDVVLLAVADEETGGAEGTEWLLTRHPELFADTRAVLTEGGGNRVFDGRVRWWGVEVAQKRPLWLEVRARGRAGHGSRRDLNTAPSRLVRALANLEALPREYRISPEARLYFESLDRLGPEGRGGWLPRLERAIANGRAERLLRPGQHNLFLDTVQITLLESGRQVNAIPAEARALIDVRTLPDTDADELLARIRRALGNEVSVEVLLDAPRVAGSPVDHPAFGCLESALGDRAPVVPALIAGVTDARHFRERGIPAYGFSPFDIGARDAQ